MSIISRVFNLRFMDTTNMSAKKNQYALLQFKRDYSSPDDKEGTQRFQKITFYHMNPDGSYENGTTLEEVISCAISRLADLNSRFACKENVKAIGHLKKAFRYLEARTADRKARRVKGKREA